MDIASVRSKSSQELREVLMNLRKESVDLVFQKRLGQSSNVSRFGLIRKSIARVLTVLNERGTEEGDA